MVTRVGPYTERNKKMPRVIKGLATRDYVHSLCKAMQTDRE